MSSSESNLSKEFAILSSYPLIREIADIRSRMISEGLSALDADCLDATADLAKAANHLRKAMKYYQRGITQYENETRAAGKIG